VFRLYIAGERSNIEEETFGQVTEVRWLSM
jgi:hypothetical protein